MTDETELATIEVGDGPAVLWVHGYTMSAAIWAPLWERLPGFRHIGVDLPGHGRSPAMAVGTTRASMAGQLNAVARAHGAERLVALSMSTLVAFEALIAGDHPFTKVVVAAPTLAGMETADGAAERYRQLFIMRRAGAPRELMNDVWMASPPDIFTGLRRHPSAFQGVADVVAGHSWKELETGAMALVGEGVQEPSSIAPVEGQLLVVVGDDDMPAFRKVARQVHASVPGSRLVELAGAGHLPLLEVPDEVAPVLADHLAAGT